ncbi:MAG: hypothetical protein EPO08_14075, partial [Rhodospirillaceae bacterium]
MDPMAEPINICICVPSLWDARAPEERAEILRKFRDLDERIQFQAAAYVDSIDIRAVRGQGRRDEARGKVAPPTPDLRAALAEAHIILAIDLPFDMDVLAPNLRWVQSIGAGVGQLQTCGLEKNNVLLTSGAGIASDPIAEFVLARILSHWKLFSLYDQMQKERRWEPTYGRNLAGSTIGIVGFGAIGSAIAWRAKAWGMRVLATRRHLPAGFADPAVDRFYPPSDLKEMLASADAVALCAPETPETYQMFNA